MGKTVQFLSTLCLCMIAGQCLAEQQYCYNDVVGACSPVGGEVTNCDAKYGGINEVVKDLQSYANLHIARNFQFLLMSTHFTNYEKNRQGFAKLYRGISDELWEDSIKLIKHITKRGGKMDFTYKKQLTNDVTFDNYEFYEVGSLGRALDAMKSLASEGMEIHGNAGRRKELHEPEVSSFLENEFLHEHAETIRKLAGHTSDLKNLISSANDASIAVHLFDNYLKL